MPAETVSKLRSRFGLPEPVEHCLSSAMTTAYYVAFTAPELFGQMEFWQAETDSGPHLYIAIPVDEQMQVFSEGVTWPDEKYPAFDYDSLRQNASLADRTKIDRFVQFALEGGGEMKRTIDLITKPDEFEKLVVGLEQLWEETV